MPKVICGTAEFIAAAKFGYTLKSHKFRHLGVGVHVIKIVYACSKAVQHFMVRETPCGIQVAFVTGHRIGIGIYFRHTTVLAVKHGLHLLVRQPGGQIHAPVAQTEKQTARLFVAGVQPCVT